MGAFFISNDIYKETLFSMKDINEQIERIKQLFTEERLYGNLVEQQTRKEKRQAKKDSRRQEGYKDFGNYKLNKAAYEYKDGSVKLFLHKDATKDVEKLASERDNQIGKSNNEEQEQKIRDKYDKRIAEINDAKNYLYLILTSEENAKNKIQKLIKTYFDKKRPETKLNTYKIIQKDFDEEDGEYSYYIELDTVPLKDLTPTPDTEGDSNAATKVNTLRKGSKGKEVKNLQKALGITADGVFGNKTYEALKQFQKENGLSVDGVAGPKTMALISNMRDSDNSVVVTDNSGESKVSTGKSQVSTEKPETKTEKPETKTKTEKTGDFTKPLQKLGGSQKGYTYHLVGPKKAEKRDATTGKVVATYIKETTFNKKALFESAYTFDINNSLTENWKWVEGNGGKGQTFSDNLSKKFDDAIAQISGETPVDSNTETDTGDDIPTDKEIEDASNAELDKIIQTPVKRGGGTTVVGSKGWDKYPCVTVYPGKKEKKYKDGTKSYIIGNVLFFSSGKCQDTNTKEVKSYECKNGKIFIEGEEWSNSGFEITQVDISKDGEEKPKGDKSSEGGNIYQQLSNNPTPEFIADTIKGADKINDDEALAQSAFAAIKDIKTYKNVTDILGEDVFQFIKGFMGTSPNYHEGNKVPTIDNHLLSIFGSKEEYNKFKETGIDPTAGSVENNEDDNTDSL